MGRTPLQLACLEGHLDIGTVKKDVEKHKY